MYTAKPLAFPGAKVWADLFEDWHTWNGSEDWRHPWTATDYLGNMGRRKPKVATCYIGPYLHFRSYDRTSQAVKARPQVYEAIKTRTVFIADDHMHFEVIERDDGTALVTCSHSRILGGVWLAVIDASTIPVPKRED